VVWPASETGGKKSGDETAFVLKKGIRTKEMDRGGNLRKEGDLDGETPRGTMRREIVAKVNPEREK